MRKIKVFLMNELKFQMKNALFIKLFLPYLAIVSLILIVSWPGGDYPSFRKPQVSMALVYVQMIFLAYIGGRLAIESFLNDEISLKDWLKYTPLTPIQIVIGKIAGIFLFTLIILFLSLPLCFLSYYIGGVYFDSIAILYSLMLISTVSFINFGLSLQFIQVDFSSFILTGIVFLFGLGLFLTRTSKEKFFYLNPLFFLLVFAVSLSTLFIFLKKLKNMKKEESNP